MSANFSLASLVALTITFANVSHASVEQEGYETGKITFNIGSSNDFDEDNSILPNLQNVAGLSYKSESYPRAHLHIGYSYINERTPLLEKVIIPDSENNLNSHNVIAGISIGF